MDNTSQANRIIFFLRISLQYENKESRQSYTLNEQLNILGNVLISFLAESWLRRLLLFYSKYDA